MSDKDIDVRLRELERKIEVLQDDWVSLARDVTTVLEASRRGQKGTPLLLGNGLSTTRCPDCPEKYSGKPCVCPPQRESSNV